MSDKLLTGPVSNPEALAEKIRLTTSGRHFLDVGAGRGALVLAWLRQGVDAQGVDVSPEFTAEANAIAPGRFQCASPLALPFDAHAFDTVVAVDCLDQLAEEDVAQAIDELTRVCSSALYVKLDTTRSAEPNRRVTLRSRKWWEERFFKAGFRKHPAYYQINSYESLENENGPIEILLEKIPAAAALKYPLDALAEERDLHMDMFRESGSRSDAHVMRYQWATQFIRPGDTVLDAACGLGYGSYLLQACSTAQKTLGIDGSAYAVDYAHANYAARVDGLDFRLGMLPEALAKVADASVDVVVSFETLEHVEDNIRLLEEFRRVLTPGGRIVASIPNDWSDESGEDPNPFHLHVYTLERLRAEMERYFVIEALAAQDADQHKAGPGRKQWKAASRSLKDVPLSAVKLGQEPDAEWWLSVAMKTPMDSGKAAYRETNYPVFTRPDWNVTTFARDYENPWLVRSMVDTGHRLRNADALFQLAQSVVAQSPPSAPDVGAALCVMAYQLLNAEMVDASKVDALAARIDAYLARDPATPHGVRWRISLLFVLGKLWMAHGDFQRSERALEQCVMVDPLLFSPLLSNRTVEAWLELGLYSLGRNDLTQAEQRLREGIRQARRAVVEGWDTAMGDVDNPAEFSLPELASILEFASSCAFALANLKNFSHKTWWWLHPRRDRLSQSRKLRTEHLQTLAALNVDLSQVHGVLAGKHDALAGQAEEIHRLELAVGVKDELVQKLGTELHRLEVALGVKDELAQKLGSEIHRLEIAVQSKDELAQKLGAEVHRLETAWAAKDEAVQQLDVEIRRLEADAQGKQIAVQELSAARQALLDDAQNQRSMMEGLRLSALEDARINAAMQSQIAQLQERVDELSEAAQRRDQERDYFYAEVAKRDRLLATEMSTVGHLRNELTGIAQQLQSLKLTRWFRLREVLLFHPFGARKVIHLGCIVAGAAVPSGMRATVVPMAKRLLGLTPVAAPRAAEGSGAYQIKQPRAPASDASKVVHVIANFMTGGSSRLVVDLLEYLGGDYRQMVLTSFNPDPPAYVGMDIEECRATDSVVPYLAYFQRVQPDMVHVHYWGDCDEPWYANVIEAARQLNLPVIENINTPIKPYRSDAVLKYVYVSDYVRSVFGESDPRHVTVYPGSDFKLFTRSAQERVPDDCVGMVYRLERDKLNEDAIQPFIHIARLRPNTRVLIVGGGSLLEPFQAAVAAAGVAGCFEFTGYVPYDALPALYRRMSLFVAPVWKESFGQVSSFAMSMKVPVIGYDIGAIGEIVNNPDLLAPPADAEQLAQIAVRLLDAPDEIRRLGDDQQRRAQENFSIQAMIAHYAQLYAEIIKNVRQERL